MLKNLNLVLVRPRFPENIGMAARACANTGCECLTLVNPENFDLSKAEKTATAKGLLVLKSAKFAQSLEDALEESNTSWALSARTGGWRKEFSTPEQAAGKIARELLAGKKVALVLGNEKSGLDNSEVLACSWLVRIPVYGILQSYNLAQSALIILYETAKAANNLHYQTMERAIREKMITHKEIHLLESQFKAILIDLDCCQGKNPDYHFIIWQKMLRGLNLRRHEFDAWMGFCRQIRRLINITKKWSDNA